MKNPQFRVYVDNKGSVRGVKATWTNPAGTVVERSFGDTTEKDGSEIDELSTPAIIIKNP